LEQDSTLTRRHVVTVGAAAAVGAAGVTTLAACGGSSGGTGTTASTSTSAPAADPSSATSSATSGSDVALAKVSDVPVGGAISANSAEGKPIILSQPTSGDIVGFSAICTHMGCTVAPAGAQLKCPCHGSVYKASDGSVVNGPAPNPLAPFTVHVSGQDILEG
jgi:cytochrome b6-f complex iron-sulfur subunit